MTLPMPPFLKITLRLDAAVSGAAALLKAAGAGRAPAWGRVPFVTIGKS